MRILTKGKLPTEKVYEVKCRYCKTRFEFKKGEAKEVDDQRDGTYLSIRCPLQGCNHFVTTNI